MASQKPSLNYCPQCKNFPAYGAHKYCSRKCATEAGASKSSPNSDSSSALVGIVSRTVEFFSNIDIGYPTDDPLWTQERDCKNCLSRPANPPYEFCSKKCGQDFARASRAENRTSTSSSPSSPASKRYSGHTSRPSSSSIQACSPVPPVDPQYSRPVANCLMCRMAPKMSGSQFCSDGCKKDAHRDAPLLLEVFNMDPKFSDIARQFVTTWKEEGRVPPVIRVYKIVNSKKVEDAYEEYKKSVEKEGKFSTRGKMAPGNENRRWHGTVRKCNIGDSPGNLTPCNSPECFVCSILRTSYQVKRSTSGWFGKGIYTTATSSGSNEYVGVTPPGSYYRAMFLNRVVVGNAYILNKQQEGIKGPPKGFNSVIANVNQSQGLAYDELVVYKNEAIRPSWLVIYG